MWIYRCAKLVCSVYAYYSECVCARSGLHVHVEVHVDKELDHLEPCIRYQCRPVCMYAYTLS